MDKVYKKVGNEVYVIPIFDPPTHFLKEAEKPAIPHSGEPIDENGLRKLRELKKTMLNLKRCGEYEERISKSKNK